MDVLIPDNWLRDFLKTEASAQKIGEVLSLCGPSVEKIEGKGKSLVYSIEVTTNRVDSASVYGIGREAAAILPRFGIKAKLLPLRPKAKQPLSKSVGYLTAKIDESLCYRFSAILIKNVEIAQSPAWLQERLKLVGVRPINNAVDISNYIMHEIGQPVHTFDYDKIKGATMVLRKAKAGETITTLDGKTHTLPGGDIVIEDKDKRLIDLAGIMGAKNSAVNRYTKNILLFVQTYNPTNIRKTSMSLAARTKAAVLFEKGLDEELVETGIRLGIDLFVKLTRGIPEDKILDIYPKPYRGKKVLTSLDFIENRLGIKLGRKKISDSLQPLGFETFWKGNQLEVSIPSYRAKDISIPEDIVEEVARIYGYHNLPSHLMTGEIPNPPAKAPFKFEQKIKRILKGYGGIEVYTLSMVAKKDTPENSLKLKNPLGKEFEFMRTSLRPSLIKAAKFNNGEKDPFHLFEMANVYLPRKNDLPEERMTLAGIFSSYSYREAKGIIEALLEELHIKVQLEPEDSFGFAPSKRVAIKSKGGRLGEFGVLENGFSYYEFEVEKLLNLSSSVVNFVPIPKYPAQIEDLTLVLPTRTRVGEIINTILNSSKNITKTKLIKIYKDAYTFRVWYQDPDKTLTNKEVEIIRGRLLKKIKKVYGASIKA